MRTNAVWMRLILNVPGATEQQFERGLEAATRVFNTAGVDPCEGADAVFKRNLQAILCFDEGDPDYPVMSDREILAGNAWSAACNAAINACCDGGSGTSSDWALDVERAGPSYPFQAPIVEFRAAA